MSILSAGSKDCFSLFKRSMIQSKDLPLTEILDDSFVKDVFSEEKMAHPTEACAGLKDAESTVYG